MRKDLDPRFLKAASRKQGGWAGWAALAGAAIGAIDGGSKQGGSVQSTQTNSPWYGSVDHLNTIYGGANQLYNQNASLAPQSQATLQSQQMQANRAFQGNPLNQAAQQQNLATLRGDYTDLTKNPAAQSAMDLAKTNINAQFGGDNWGNSAHQEWLSRGLMGAAAPFYESERQRQMGATALAPSLANQDYTDIGQLGAVGQAQDVRAQQLTDSPWTQLQRYQQAVSGNYGGTSTNSQPYFTNPTASALGGGMAGLGLYNAMGQGGLFGGGTQQNPQSYSTNGQFTPFYSGYDAGGGGYAYG